MRARVRVMEEFDPTPQEIEKAERRQPLKLPLCIKCKLKTAVSIGQTARLDIDRYFLAIADVLKGKFSSKLSRVDVERLRGLHLHLSRAARGKYCLSCVERVKAHVDESLSNGFPT